MIDFPSEWHPQSAIQLTWPDEHTDWAYMLDDVQALYVALIKEITAYQKVLLVCRNYNKVKPKLQAIDTSQLVIVECAVDDTWARDHGGLSVFDNGLPVVCDFTFNGWGQKFNADNDTLITSNAFKQGAFFSNVTHRNHADFVLEGGSVESDGEGTVLTTANCLLSTKRNPKWSKAEIETELKLRLGAKRVLWLNSGDLEGDDTDSHIDTLARLAPGHTILYVQCTDTHDSHYEELQKMENELMNLTTEKGGAYNLIPLPMADAVYEEGRRLPATYANFLITNKQVLVPTYNSPKDELAIEAVKRAFPDRDVVGFNCLPLIRQNGSLHCITMQYPEGFIK